MMTSASLEWGNTTQDSSNIFAANRRKEFTIQEQVSKDSGSNFLHGIDSLNNSGQLSNEALINTPESPLFQSHEIHPNDLNHRNSNYSNRRLSSRFRDHSESENYVNSGSILTRHDERHETNFLKDSSTTDFTDAMISKKFLPSELDSYYLKLAPDAATDSNKNHDESVEVGQTFGYKEY